MPEPTIVMTLMVRDEADIIAAMIEHHLAEGVDMIIATDNGSVDGTREILADYGETGRVEVHDYLAHDKNQSAVVSAMASRAHTAHGATWVLNADADEFFVARDATKTLRESLARIPTGLGSFEVPVVNMSGPAARSGSALRRLTWRDVRDEASLMQTVALHAHPSSDVVHVGRAGVVVQQGNHGVDIPSLGAPDPADALEVLHFPWRTYEQYSTKVVNTGLSYESNPLVNPSPRHHGMRDYRFWRAGVLESLYIVRHPDIDEVEGFLHDDRLAKSLLAVLDEGRAIRPDLLAPALSDEWTGYTDEERVRAAEVARIVIPLEIEHIAASTHWRDLYRGEALGRRRAEDEIARMLARPESRARAFAGRVVRRARRAIGRA